MPIAFVQKNNKDEWANENCYLAARGFRKRWYDVRPFTIRDLDNAEEWLTKENILHGRPHNVLKALQKLGVREPYFHPYPPHLRVHMDRPPTEVRLSTILEEAQRPNFRPCFIKQSRGPKVFKSRVVKEYSDMVEIPTDTWVWRVPEVPLMSEYNIFVHQGLMVANFHATGDNRILSAMLHSEGDPLVFPDPVKVKKLVREAKLESVAYSLTVGVARFPERPELIRTPTILIGANDAYSLNANGLDPRLYSQMIEDRWNQMVSPVIR